MAGQFMVSFEQKSASELLDSIYGNNYLRLQVYTESVMDTNDEEKFQEMIEEGKTMFN